MIIWCPTCKENNIWTGCYKVEDDYFCPECDKFIDIDDRKKEVKNDISSMDR